LATGQAFEEESNMAERQETSVMVSIQEILRDAQSREEQEKVESERRAREDEQRRIDDVRRKQEEEGARLRAEEDERERRVFEEQKRRAELQALQDAAVQRTRMEAEAQARLAEMTARQDHERQLHALSQDKHKKRLQIFLVGLGLLLFIGAIGGGVFIFVLTAACTPEASGLGGCARWGRDCVCIGLSGDSLPPGAGGCLAVQLTN